MSRTVEQLVELLTRHDVELETKDVPRWLYQLRHRSIPDTSYEDHRILTFERGTLGIQVSARYDWDRGAFVVRDWWTFNA